MISYAFSKSIKEKNTIKMSHGLSCVNKKVDGCCFLSNKKKSKGPVAFYPESKKRIITKQKCIKYPGVFCTIAIKKQISNSLSSEIKKFTLDFFKRNSAKIRQYAVHTGCNF